MYLGAFVISRRSLMAGIHCHKMSSWHNTNVMSWQQDGLLWLPLSFHPAPPTVLSRVRDFWTEVSFMYHFTSWSWIVSGINRTWFFKSFIDSDRPQGVNLAELARHQSISQEVLGFYPLWRQFPLLNFFYSLWCLVRENSNLGNGLRWLTKLNRKSQVFPEVGRQPTIWPVCPENCMKINFGPWVAPFAST